MAQAVLLEPTNARAHSYLGVIVGKKGWLDGAEAELRRALELDETYADTHFNLAVIYLQNEPPTTELARRHYKRALELGAKPDSIVEKQLAAGKELVP
jgi:Flp pilus assembly protein TadD